MIRALLWKEYREHRSIWLALAFVSGGGLYGLSRLMVPVWGLSYTGARDSLQSVAVLFAWTYGLVCGAMLLANENEAGTMTFLDILPVRRLELWLVKCLFGVLLLLAQIAVLTGFIVGLGIVEAIDQFLITLLAMLFFGMFSLSWSLLFSARGENVLNVIGLAFVGQIAAILVGAFLVVVLTIMLAIVWGGDGETARLISICLGVFALMVGPALGSARLFTRLDRERRRSASAPSGVRRPAVTSTWASWGRVLWLSLMQMRRIAFGMTIFALALGCLLPVIGPVGWPALTLIIGVLCGVTVWSDEQISASFRFLGDQRFPLGRVWVVKVGTRFALTVFASLLLLLPSLILEVVHRLGAPREDVVPFFVDLLHCSLVGPIVPVGCHLLLWPLYGFTVGQLSSMLFRKSLVAGVVALGSAGMLVCLWIPSLLGIGLHFWQVAGVPLCLLAAGGMLMPAWAADRLLVRETFVRLGLALLAAGLWTAGGLWYRVLEIPDMPEPFDLPTFKGSIPRMDVGQNDAGLAIRAAWGEVDKMARTNYAEINGVLKRDRLDLPAGLGHWLDEQFQKEWYCGLLEAAYHPLGVVEDPSQLTFNEFGKAHNWSNVIYLNQILAIRGLQQQARGDHWTFLDNLRISLALSRNLQHRAPPFVANSGRNAEMIGIRALDLWLAKLPNYPDLLERARDILLQHEKQLPDVSDPNKANYLIAQNSLDQMPEKLVERQIHQTHGYESVMQKLGHPELRKTEIDAAALFWRIPWEHDRHERILRVAFQGNELPRYETKKWGVDALMDLRQRVPGPRSERDVAFLHAAQLKVALRLYQARNHGKLPAKLDDLVPRYLPEVPSDPFDNKPFRYRISKGEVLNWFNEAAPRRTRIQAPAPPGRLPAPGMLGAGHWDGSVPKRVARGQGILWSVGEDKLDGGGKNHHGLGDNAVNQNPDLIYLVPLPPP
jgi:hypothetical protein